MNGEKKPIGLISIVAYDSGDIELKFAGIEKENLPKIIEQILTLVRRNAN